MNESSLGRCECGAVHYALNGPPLFVNCCHCRDCQRVSGSAFAVNAMIETDCVVVTNGSLVETSSGDAGPAAWRCGTCYTLLWAAYEKFGDAMRFVRVGTLDKPERWPPDAHFFVRSKHSWVRVPDDVPQHPTLPDEGVGAALSPEMEMRLSKALGRL